MARARSGRFSSPAELDKLGLLKGLSGDWEGNGFNLIARPDFHDKANLYLQLNQTKEHLVFTPIGGPVPNRGFGQDDIELFGLTYLQKINDAGHDGALHIEPGIWVTQPDTTFPSEKAPAGGQLVARMATIPHGNAVLATGVATRFTGPPVLATGGPPYNGSVFPSFNSTPFGAPPTAPTFVINAAGSSEKLTAPKVPAAPFNEYDLTVPAGAGNPRTPFDTSPPEPPLPAAISGVAMQNAINDPILLLQAEVNQQIKDGYNFEDGVALNISTLTPVTFLTTANSGPTGPTAKASLPQFGGGPENIQFLIGASESVGGKQQPVENAQTALVYATFWLTNVAHKASNSRFMQLQYAQMVVLDFPIFLLLNPPPANPPVAPTYVNIGWPHITVATLRKSFG
jgi:hypothetical protein